MPYRLHDQDENHASPVQSMQAHLLPKSSIYTSIYPRPNNGPLIRLLQSPARDHQTSLSHASPRTAPRHQNIQRKVSNTRSSLASIHHFQISTVPLASIHHFQISAVSLASIHHLQINTVSLASIHHVQINTEIQQPRNKSISAFCPPTQTQEFQSNTPLVKRKPL